MLRKLLEAEEKAPEQAPAETLPAEAPEAAPAEETPAEEALPTEAPETPPEEAPTEAPTEEALPAEAPEEPPAEAPEAEAPEAEAPEAPPEEKLDPKAEKIFTLSNDERVSFYGVLSSLKATYQEEVLNIENKAERNSAIKNFKKNIIKPLEKKAETNPKLSTALSKFRSFAGGLRFYLF